MAASAEVAIGRGALNHGVSYLLPYYDPELPVGQEAARELVAAERARLTKMVALIDAVGQIPRRLGPEASGEDLAADKRKAKRVSWAVKQCLDAWGSPVKGTFDVRAEAAQLDWNKWWGDHQVWLNNRMRYIATWGIKNGNEKWAKTALVKLINELRWLQYAMR